ncbi:MAG: tRNA lysidine(34) synthetase TilS [Deltaproteobacteria bacterium]|nr:tRNA lysidine(34) synthetase TilS [Deltaproteobacteria bacterium]
MLSLVSKTIRRFNMLIPGDSVVVGVSGGSDSLGLLHILTELKDYRLKLIVAHLNHGIRGGESKRDAEYVRKLADKLGLPFELRETNVIEFKKSTNLSLEEAARELRYEFLREVLNKYNATKIATGHTLDDQAETVLMRFIRGSGLLGLSGIPAVNDNVIRPLIEIRKSEIEEYLRSKGIGWMEDSSNKMKVFLRNRIRNELIPQLVKYNPKIKETLARTGYIVGVQEDYIRTEAKKHFNKLFYSSRDGELVGRLRYFNVLSMAMKYALLRLAIENLKGDLKRISLTHVVSVNELLDSREPSGEVYLPGEIVVAKGYGLFLVTKKTQLRRSFSYTVDSAGLHKFPQTEFEIQIKKVNSLKSDNYLGCFDTKSVEFPIEVRNFNKGDRFIPYGMNDYKSLKNYFIDEKIPQFLRYRIPIFLCKGEVMWIGGMRVDERFKVRDKRKKVLTIRLLKPNFEKLEIQ